jgi:two-component system sensor histidine kinase HydH
MKLKYAFVIVVALVFTGFAVFNSITTYRVAEQSFEETLNATAYFIGITLNQTLHRTGIDEELFSDVMLSQPREEIAFIALYNEEGRTLLHSRKNLIGTSPDDPKMGVSMKSAKPVTYFHELDTGEQVYIMDMPTQVYDDSPVPLLLRIALYTETAQDSLVHAKVHALTALVIIAFVWILTFGVVNYSRKVIALNMKEMEKRHFTMLGEMAAVLAHEIRSPLSAIKGFAQYISEKKENTSSTAEGIDVIITESQRLERLTEDLLVYARVSEVNAGKFSLPELVDEVEGLFITDEKSVTITKNITLKNDTMNTDRGKLKQILINVIQNALDSIEGSGTIGINMSDHTHVINISIKDSGKGMDKETVNNALRPFFTSKAKGTGLGLAIVDNLLKTLHGSLAIESEPGKGTEVILSIQRNIP